MPSREQHLYETEATGPLDVQGYPASREDTSRPSLSGAYSGPGAGLGGTDIPMKDDVGNGAYGPGERPKASRKMTPEEMMLAADEIQKDYQFTPGPSSVQPTLDRPSALERSDRRPSFDPMEGFGGQYLGQEAPANAGQPNSPPEWLKQYMDSQPPTDPYHTQPMSKVDMVNNNQYLNEREKLKMLKSLKDQGKLVQ